MRLFVAINLPEEVRINLHRQARDSIERVGITDRDARSPIKWVQTENLHLTLKFLGEVAEADLPPLKDAVFGVPTEGPLVLRLQRTVFFPHRGPVRIMGGGVVGDIDRLLVLQRNIESACETLGYPREQRRFSPHITVARAKFGLPGSIRDVVHQNENSPPFAVSEFFLMQSVLSASGPKYSEVARIPLG